MQLWRSYSGIGTFAATGAAMVLFSLLKPQSDPPRPTAAPDRALGDSSQETDNG
jgi:hypothetical protein